MDHRKMKAMEGYILLLADLCCIAAAYAAAILIRYQRFRWVMNPDVHILVCICFLLFCVVYRFLLDWNLDFLKRGALVEFIQVCKFNILMLLAVGCFLFLIKRGTEFSRLVMGYFVVLCLLLMWVVRLLLKRVLRGYFTSSHNRVKVMVIARREGLEEIVENLQKKMPLNYEVVSLACLDEDLQGRRISRVEVTACRNNVLEVARQIPLDEIFLNLPGEDREYVAALLYDLETMGVTCHYNLDIMRGHQKEIVVDTFANYTVATYTLNHLDSGRQLIKRFMDILGGVLGLAVTAVLTPFIALAVRLDSPGPVFFSQIRIGKNGRRFRLYKFRSMYVDAEERKKELEDQNEIKGLMFKIENDPRITRVGRFLRRTSLDELPQFFNILKGDMSLVGTRPPTEEEFEQYNPYYRRRISMTPGLTGLWQVSGRSDVENFDDVVKYDLEYIDDWSLTLDLKILLQTIVVVLTGKGSK